MNLHFGNNTQTGSSAQAGKSYFFEIEVGPNPETLENYMRRVFAGVGLKSEYSIKAFDNFMGQSFFRQMINNAGNNAAVAAAVLRPNGKKTKITVQVFPSIVDKLKRFGINLALNSQGRATFAGHSASFTANVEKYRNFTPAPETPIAQWSSLDKLGAVIKRAALLLPEEVGKELLKLLDPAVLAIVAGVVVVWAASHFFGVGEIVDVVLLIVGIVSLGPIAWDAGKHLINFAVGTVNAKTDEDLDEAAKHLSEAIALLGVQVVMTLLLKKAPKVLNEPKVLMNQAKPSVPLTMKTVGEPPVTPGKLFYEPNFSAAKHPFPGTEVGGATNKWGDISLLYGKNATPKSIELAKFHEEVHRLLTPKLQTFTWLRQARTVLKVNSYLKSYLLRYIEEALAQTVAQVRGNGWRMFFEGIKFPVGNEGYVTVAKMGVEAKGILLGPINVGGMLCRVYFSFTDEW